MQFRILNKVDSEEVLEDLRGALEEARKAKGFTIDYLAVIAGMHPSTYDRFVREKKNITCEKLARLFLALDFDLTAKPLRDESRHKINSN